MKPETTKFAGLGLALGTLALCASLFGCGGNGAVPVANIPKNTALPVVCSNAANGARFQVDDFGAGFFPYTINATGQVAGYKLVNGHTRTMVTQNGTTTDIGIDDSLPVTINGAGQVAGNTLVGFVWQGGHTTWLKNLPGGASNVVLDMNNNGELVGAATTGQKTAMGSDVYHAVYWASAQAAPQDLGILSAGDDQSQADSINDQGQIVGFSGVVLGKAEYVYLSSHGASMTDLGILEAQAGKFGYAALGTIFISKSGLIIGITFYNGVSDSQVFLTRPGSAPTFDPTLGGPSKPNAQDQFVSTTKAGGYALYAPGKGDQDLIAQLPASCSVQLKAPFYIADSGQIVANGTLNSANHGFLITP